MVSGDGVSILCPLSAAALNSPWEAALLVASAHTSPAQAYRPSRQPAGAAGATSGAEQQAALVEGIELVDGIRLRPWGRLASSPCRSTAAAMAIG